MHFISGKDTFESVAELLKSEDVEIALAVAFWGGDAMERLGVATPESKFMAYAFQKTGTHSLGREPFPIFNGVASSIDSRISIRDIRFTPLQIQLTGNRPVIAAGG